MIIGGIIGVIIVLWYAPTATIIAALNLAIIGAVIGGVIGGLCGLIVELTIKRRHKPTSPDLAKDTD